MYVEVTRTPLRKKCNYRPMICIYINFVYIYLSDNGSLFSLVYEGRVWACDIISKRLLT